MNKPTEAQLPPCRLCEKGFPQREGVHPKKRENGLNTKSVIAP